MRPAYYLKSSYQLLINYNGNLPFSNYLKAHFKKFPAMGSRDRKTVSEICFNWFRWNLCFDKKLSEENLCAAFWLSGNFTPKFYENFPDFPMINELSERISFFSKNNLQFKIDLIFPCGDEIGEISDKNKFIISHTKQAKIWFRVKKNKFKEVIQILNQKGIEIDSIIENYFTLGFNKNLDFEKIFGNYHIFGEVQDLSSVKSIPSQFKPGEKIWDVCSGAGGKTLMIADRFESVQIYASDIRSNIIENLKKRFQQAQIQTPIVFEHDGEKTMHKSSTSIHQIIQSKNDGFNSILADVPCSGSGTWSRNPEFMAGFTSDKIEKYSEKQRQIVLNALAHLKKGGQLLYITCSVYKKENEDQVEFFLNNSGLELIEKNYIEGFEIGADTLFFALFQKIK